MFLLTRIHRLPSSVSDAQRFSARPSHGFTTSRSSARKHVLIVAVKEVFSNRK